MFLYIKTNILRGYGIFKNDFAHPREPATGAGCVVGPCVGQSGKRSLSNTEHTDIFISQRRLKIFDPCLILD